MWYKVVQYMSSRIIPCRMLIEVSHERLAHKTEHFGITGNVLSNVLNLNYPRELIVQYEMK